MKTKICVVTGSRADFGLLRPLLCQIKKDPDADLQLLVTGSHLSRKYGLTYKEILESGFVISRKVDLRMKDDSTQGICTSIGVGVSGISFALAELRPEIVIILGDRFEALAAAIAAHVSRIPIVHIHGGEKTEGAIDEAFRHAITKMSLLHFTTTEEYRRTVIQLGESPNRVFNVGSLGVENIRTCRLLDKQEVEKALGLKFAAKNILVTFHPVTLETATSKAQFKELLEALKDFKEVRVIFTKPNADTDNRQIRALIDDHVKDSKGMSVAFESLGMLRYLSTVQFVDAVVGNSSSGIIEVPSLGKPTVNIGDRQKGRVRAKSVLDVQPQKRAIVRAIHKALTPGFASFCRAVKNPYAKPNTAQAIYKIIKSRMNALPQIKKTFYTTGNL